VGFAMTILKENFMEALQLAIWYWEEHGSDYEDFCPRSAKVNGWQMILDALRNDEEVKIDN